MTNKRKDGSPVPNAETPLSLWRKNPPPNKQTVVMTCLWCSPPYTYTVIRDTPVGSDRCPQCNR